MIYTITFNPSLDYFVYLDQELTEGSIIKTKNTAIRAGGNCFVAYGNTVKSDSVLGRRHRRAD